MFAVLDTVIVQVAAHLTAHQQFLLVNMRIAGKVVVLLVSERKGDRSEGFVVNGSWGYPVNMMDEIKVSSKEL